jgi:adenylosuccinate synthase
MGNEMMLKRRWFVQGKVSAIVGGQFGSEAKGLAAAYMTYHEAMHDPSGDYVFITNAGAQAGHTTIRIDGSKYICYHLPTGFVEVQKMGGSACAYVNAGAVIDTDLMRQEIEDTGVDPSQIRVNAFAAVISDRDKDREKTGGPNRIASTGKGIGSALSRKIMRGADSSIARHFKEEFMNMGVMVTDSPVAPLSKNSYYGLEIPQGTSLSINNSGMYPYTTSRDCWISSGLNDAGIHPHYLNQVCMVVRTFPIRVGNTTNEDGTVNSSGPFYEGSEELKWSYFGPHVEPERTTVTKRIRRIATWSNFQYERSCTLNRPDIVFLSFVNYLNTPDELITLMTNMENIHRRLSLSPYTIYSWGPGVADCGSFSQAIKFLANRGPIR